ncbi:helix-turn-helix transcriptional regulator [Streptomyces iconiensis]|uniref:Helix-turn-helix transcriptional regulator n=1 Tax=Streptomyces iconiensis TaxID=1384038 RepID=A0ABT7A6V2_9ACTN|nr:helix-turn-helix transcriptional regulator [Streptomyces iconiensis]MDJ1137070.1 helix-turn-helix transcriptional regulator [Streptomyces iconiensis]
MPSQLALRRRVAGYSQEEFAVEMSVATTTVRRWERGETTPQGWQCPRLCALLGLTPSELAELLREAGEGGEPVKRRTFLADASAMTAAAALPAPPGSHAEVVDYFRDQLGGYHKADTVLGSARVLPAVQQGYVTLVQLAHGARGADRRDLWQLTAAYAARLTWLHQDAGAMDEADRWAARSIELAHRSADPQLTAHVLVNRAMIDTDLGDGPGTVELVGVALGGGGRALCPKVRVQALQQAAHGHALSGDRVAADGALRQAAPLVAQINDEYPWGVAGKAPTYLPAQRATCYSRLRLGDEAADAWADVLGAQHPARDRAVFTARYAQALADARQPEHAAEVLTDAATTAAQAGSARLKREILTAWEQLKPWHHSAPGRRARRVLATAGMI